jgi:hypothetical protein
MRTELGLTLSGVCSLYSLVQALALLGELQVNGGVATLILEGQSINLEILRSVNLQDFLGRIDSLDITHLSKFERGEQIPWTRARARLTFLFSLIYGKRLAISDVFPELEHFPGLKSYNKDEGLLDV